MRRCYSIAVTPEDLIRVRRDLAAIRTGIEELRDAIQEHSKAIHAAEERKRHECSTAKTVHAVIAYDNQTKRDTKTEFDRQYRTQNSIRWAAWFAFGAASIYAGVAAYQLKEMRRASRTAQTSVEAIQAETFQEERPWISVDVAPASNFAFDQNGGGALALDVTLRNHGHSVAQYINVETDLVIGDEQWPAVQKRICGIPRDPINAKSVYGYLLFPEQTIKAREAAAVTGERVRQALAGSLFKISNFISVDLVICVDYRSVLEATHHQTRRTLGLGYPDHIRKILMGAFIPGREYRDLEFTPLLQGDSAD
jgi:hypothetical protein